MNLEDKLKKLKFSVGEGPRSIRLDDKDVEAVKAVFVAAGWRPKEQAGDTRPSPKVDKK